jgi:hypothetical protein
MNARYRVADIRNPEQSSLYGEQAITLKPLGPPVSSACFDAWPVTITTAESAITQAVKVGDVVVLSVVREGSGQR